MLVAYLRETRASKMRRFRRDQPLVCVTQLLCRHEMVAFSGINAR